jgi:hypothetical protein
MLGTGTSAQVNPSADGLSPFQGGDSIFILGGALQPVGGSFWA